eukprot:5069623-Pyramimonas_sp.AAC.1
MFREGPSRNMVKKTLGPSGPLLQRCICNAKGYARAGKSGPPFRGHGAPQPHAKSARQYISRCTVVTGACRR